MQPKKGEYVMDQNGVSCSSVLVSRWCLNVCLHTCPKTPYTTADGNKLTAIRIENVKNIDVANIRYASKFGRSMYGNFKH